MQSGRWYELSWALIGFLKTEQMGQMPSGCVFFGSQALQVTCLHLSSIYNIDRFYVKGCQALWADQRSIHDVNNCENLPRSALDSRIVVLSTFQASNNITVREELHCFRYEKLLFADFAHHQLFIIGDRVALVNLDLVILL